MKCTSGLLKIRVQGKFTGCDGKEWDNDFLLFHLQKAIHEENYEWAKDCKEELDRRLESPNSTPQPK